MLKFSFMLPVVAAVSCTQGPGPITPATPVERQMVGLLEKFDRWDENGDGHLTAAELGKAEKLTGHTPEKIIEFYDANGDRRITLREAQKGLDRPEEAERAARR